MNTDECVVEALNGLRTTTETTVTPLFTDVIEERLVSEFMTSGCGCAKAKGQPCLRQFSPEYVKSVRESCAELTRGELDMVILGQLMASVNTSTTVSTTARHEASEREKSYTIFTHQGKPICTRMFRFLHGIGNK